MQTFPPQVLEPSPRGLAAGAPLPAPPGTLFALGASGGYAVPRREFTLHFGRGSQDEAYQVHVPIGAGDPHISRRHGRLCCDGRDWWLRNDGKLPIRLPGDRLLLSGRDLRLEAGYLPVFLGRANAREHLLEVRVVGLPGTEADHTSGESTVLPPGHVLSAEERLVLTALAQRYLRQERHAQPVAWAQVAADLDELPDGRGARSQRPANTVDAVRRRLHREGVRGLTLAEVGQPVGNTINHNLIQELLKTVTLSPADLRLLDED
ncbi:hypothetical protein JOF53_007314 [Crossiella equi]|uniref:FHA domain-containing protein n=1 Tax=Crossiella equi TaxID=130796 RepID=A0ABS5AQB3_9PSEU|nr:FHA domain-containing protein [Crossiella equi]MBP2478442.1 hypothetical protein [Crossiella equi]